VDSREALDRVATWRAMTRVFVPRIELVVPELPENEVRERQARLDSLTDACGCGEGSAVALAGLGLYLAYALSIGPDLGAWGQTWRAALVVFVGATLGKLIGLARARVRLHRELRDLPIPRLQVQ
jgi:hypothetical protein